MSGPYSSKQQRNQKHVDNFPAGTYLLKINNGNSRTIFEIFLKLTKNLN